MIDLVARFEDCTLPTAEFHHAQHVRVAWEYLREEASPIDALRRFATNLRRFADHHGASTLYHETITWAYVVLIHERMLRAPEGDWSSFAEANADLLTWKPSILERYYTNETLFSDLARRAFVMPDRSGAAGFSPPEMKTAG